MPTYNKDAYDISRAFGRIENELLGSMMRNMGRHRAEERDYGFDWPQWQALQLQELRRYREENKEKFREDFDNINSQVESALRMAYESGQSDQEAVILDQIRRGKLEANRSFDADFFRLNNRRIDSLVEATTNDIKTAEQAILRMANDKYRQIVFDAQVYFASGGGTYEKVVDMAAHDMLMAGLNCIEYKNGARHTAADYAEMVIRTSGQRAYLRGEGQKRNEWGVHTVIVNKRGNPCPKCAPWCGKVMIDDVYAGATASEAKESGYPRVSTAMQAGFLHPRCKDTYTTWFPGVSQKPKPWTKEELAALDENARKEAEQKHAEKMAEKCDRVSEFSLDPEKQKIYEKRAEQWGEKAENLKSEELTQRRRQRLAERRRKKNHPAFDQMSAGQLRDYIDNNLVTEFTGLDGANTDFVREAVKVISTFEEMMGGKTIDGLSVQFGGTPKGVYAKYNDKTKTILLKKTGSIEKLEESLKRENLRYRMRWKTDKDYHATETFSGQIWHELGHAVDVDTGQALSRSLSADSALDELSVKVSSYAGSTQNVRATKRSEAWAENFAAYMDGGRNKERVPKQIEEKIKGYFEQKAAGKAKNVAKAGKRKPKKADVPDVKAKEPFIPAKTIEEAQEYAQTFVESRFMDKTFKGQVVFKGISVDHANEINRALIEVFEQFPELEKLSGIKTISPTSAAGKKAFKDGADALFSYDPIQNGVFINKNLLKNAKSFEAYKKQSKESWNLVMGNLDKLSGAQRELAEKYAAAGRSLVDGDTVKGLFTHELGHHVQWTMLDPKTTNSLTSRMMQYAPKISGYAQASGSEYLAESFTAYMKGERYVLDPEYVRVLDSKVKLKKYTVLKGHPDEVKKPITFTISDNHSIIMTSKQKGKKLSEHCKDYGLDPSKPEDREWVVNHIADILQNHDIRVRGIFRGQGEFIEGTKNRKEGPVWFYIKGEDVVVVNGSDQEFVTILKGGARSGESGNKRVQGALYDYYSKKRE